MGPRGRAGDGVASDGFAPENIFEAVGSARASLSNSAIAMVGQTLQASAELFGLRHRGYSTFWSAEGGVVGCEANCALSSLGHFRL